MEVHSHTHTPRKKWSHYVWEFLMLFLAVFCGFLAENQREHIVEHQREKKYIQSLLQDLKQDTSALQENINSRARRRIAADSLIYLLSSPDGSSETLHKIYKYTIDLYKIVIFNYSNSTIQQLKNSGLMRLIRKPDVVNSLSLYDLLIARHRVREDNELDLTHEFQKSITAVMDARTIETLNDSIATTQFKQPEKALKKPDYRPLLTRDPEKINLVKGLAAQLYSRNLLNYFWLERFREQAKETIALIKKEYRLE